jgi:propionyl-CoA synthetase
MTAAALADHGYSPMDASQLLKDVDEAVVVLEERRRAKLRNYRSTYQRSIQDPEEFWLEAARDIDWIVRPTKVLGRDRLPMPRWFPDGELNTCYNLLDRHVAAGLGDQLALIYDSPVSFAKRKLTYAQLLREVALFAGALRSLGITKGDRVVIYMPMIPEAVVAMLACARLGAVHSVVFSGFAWRELAFRIDDATPKVIVSASSGISGSRVMQYKPELDRAIDEAQHKPEYCIILQRPQGRATLVPGRDADWDELVSNVTPANCVAVKATDPLYILYTSGTTRRPRGVVRDNGGHAVALRWSMGAVFDIWPGDVFWAASDVGFAVGHSYGVYAPLFTGATTVLYEGKPVGTPDAGAFWRVAAEYHVKALFATSTSLRSIKREDPEGILSKDFQLGDLELLFLAGERTDRATYEWAEKRLGARVVDHWWQTETGWPISSNLMGLEPKAVPVGSQGVPVPGFDIVILDEGGEECPPGTEGFMTLRLPLPPGCLTGLWKDDDGFVHEYLDRFPGYYSTGDAGEIDEDGFVYFKSRTDDVIIVSGYHISSSRLEEILCHHYAVAECAVIGVADELKGQVPRGYVVVRSGVDISVDELRRDLVEAVRWEFGRFAGFQEVSVVPALPKTSSGKILRRLMRDIADGREAPVPSSIDDPAVLDQLRRLPLSQE